MIGEYYRRGLKGITYSGILDGGKGGECSKIRLSYTVSVNIYRVETACIYQKIGIGQSIIKLRI